MYWKKNLETLENSKDWEQAIALIKKVIDHHPNDVEAFIRAIYLFHNVLLEQNYPAEKQKELWALLKQYFALAQEMFSNNAEYLFFVGKISYIAEWYFGLNDDLLPIEQKTAFKMQKKALQMEKDNILFECTYCFSLHDPKAIKLAKLVLSDHKKIAWLNSKGYPGKYILTFLEHITKGAK